MHAGVSHTLADLMFPSELVLSSTIFAIFQEPLPLGVLRIHNKNICICSGIHVISFNVLVVNSQHSQAEQKILDTPSVGFG